MQPLTGPSDQVGLGETLSFWGSGRGSRTRLTGTVKATIDHQAGRVIGDYAWLLKEYPKSRIAFDPTIPGRNGTARHYLVDVNGTLYRPNLSRISPPSDLTNQDQ
jgi:hypothetical protein